MFRCSQGAHYPCLLKLHFVKIVSYCASVYDQIYGDVTAYIGSVLVHVYVALFGSRLFLRQSLVHSLANNEI